MTTPLKNVENEKANTLISILYAHRDNLEPCLTNTTTELSKHLHTLLNTLPSWINDPELRGLDTRFFELLGENTNSLNMDYFDSDKNKFIYFYHATKYMATTISTLDSNTGLIGYSRELNERITACHALLERINQEFPGYPELIIRLDHLGVTDVDLDTIYQMYLDKSNNQQPEALPLPDMS